MSKVVLTFEDTPEGLLFTEDFDMEGAAEGEISAAALVGTVVVKLVEELLGTGDEEELPAEDVG